MAVAGAGLALEVEVEVDVDVVDFDVDVDDVDFGETRHPFAAARRARRKLHWARHSRAN